MNTNNINIAWDLFLPVTIPFTAPDNGILIGLIQSLGQDGFYQINIGNVPTLSLAYASNRSYFQMGSFCYPMKKGTYVSAASGTAQFTYLGFIKYAG